MPRPLFRLAALLFATVLTIAFADPLLTLARTLPGQMAALSPRTNVPAPANSTSPNFTLVNGIFASGNGSTPMTSPAYRLYSTTGETALSEITTTLTSTAYKHVPGFLAANPTVSLQAYLPMARRGNFTGPFEQEDNDFTWQANGPLTSGTTYQGYPDDQNDYFSLYVRNPGNITVNLTNITGNTPQLQLRDNAGNLVGFAGGVPFQITYNNTSTTPSWYYVRIYVSGDFTPTAYSLVTTFP